MRTTIDTERRTTRELLTVNEAAEELRIGRTLAYELARRYLATDGHDGIPVVRLGTCLRVPRWALVELARNGRVVTLGAVEPAAAPIATSLPGRRR